MSDPTQPGQPIGPEVDDTTNPTDASPADADAGAHSTDYSATGMSGAEHASSRTQDNVRDMLAQLQAMIDNVAEHAGPVLRDVAAKAAELAAVAGERAGPIAYRAAEKTQVVGQRVAQRSKELAADIRRGQPGSEAPTTNTGDAMGEAGVEADEGDDETR